MEDKKQIWHYSMLNTTVDRKGPRPAVTPPNAHELVGVFGQYENGLSPFPGFKKAYEFDRTVNNPGDGQYSWIGTFVILEMFPFDFKIGDSGDYGYGFVYRVGHPSGTGNTTVQMDYVHVDSTGAGIWRRNYVIGTYATTPERDSLIGRQMSISTWGKFVYVFVEGYEPRAFWRNDTTSKIEVLTNTGPGRQPTLLSPSTGRALGTIVSTSTGAPGSGQIFLTEFAPDELSSGINVGTSDSIQSGGVQGRSEVARLRPGSYAFAYVLYNSKTGRRTGLSQIAYATPSDFDPDGTGSLPAVDLKAAIEICYDKTLYDQAYVYRSVRVETAGGTYVAGIFHLDNILNLANHDSGVTPTTPATYDHAIYYYELDDNQLVRQDTFVDYVAFDDEMPKAGCAAMYDNLLVCGNIRGASNSSSYANRRDDTLRGMGELRWSSTSEKSPELFSPQNKYIPKNPNNKVIAFEQVGPNLIGFSRDRQYLIRKENGVSIYEIHAGYGVVNSNASETLGTTCYFITEKGLKAIDSQAQLDDVKSLNEVIQVRWATTLKFISMAHDPGAAALFILNSSTEETYILWFNSARVTSLVDTAFAQVKRGVWPREFPADYKDATNTDWGRPLVERAFFVHNPPLTSENPSLFIVDHLKERIQTYSSTAGYVSKPRRTLYPLLSDSIFTVSSLVGTTLTVKAGTTLDATPRVSGCKMYVLKASDRTLVGKRVKVLSSNTGAKTFTLSSGSELTAIANLKEDDVVGLSPVVVRWVGHPAGLGDQEPDMVSGLSFFRVRHFDSIALTISDVNNNKSAQVEGIIKSLAYLGNDDNPTAVGYTLDTSGGWENALSNYEGVYYAAFESPSTSTTTQPKYGVEGSCLTPGFQIIYPDADFNVLGVIVTGSIRGTSRTRRPV